MRPPATAPVGPHLVLSTIDLTSRVVQKNFVDTVRAVELLLGIPVQGMSLGTEITTTNFTQALDDASNLTNIFNENVRAALAAAAPILVDLAVELAVPALLDVNLGGNVDRTSLITK